MALKLDKIIQIEMYSTVQNENGFDEEHWKPFKKAFASINNLYGKEFWNAKAVQSEKTVEFTLRYDKHLEILDSKNYRILYNKKVYDIQFIDNKKYENTWLKIKAICNE